MFSQFLLAFFATLNFPLCQQVWAIGEASLDSIHIVFRNRLENDPAKLILQKLDFRARFNAMLSAEVRRDHQLAFGGERST